MIENDNDNDINFDEEIAYLPHLKLEQEKIEINLQNKLPNKLRRIKMSDLNLHGVENLKKVGVAVASLINAGLESKSDDGKITFGDLAHFIKVVPDVLAAIPAIAHVKAEITDKITTEELNDFKNTVLPNVELKNELDKQFIAQLIDALHLISKLVGNRIERGKEVSS